MHTSETLYFIVYCSIPVNWECPSVQYTTVYHSISQYTIIYHSIPQYIQYTTVYHSISQYTTVYNSISQYTTVYHSIQQYITVYHSIPQYTTVCSVYYLISCYRLPLNERFCEMDEVLWGMQIASGMDFLISKDVRYGVKGQMLCYATADIS